MTNPSPITGEELEGVKNRVALLRERFYKPLDEEGKAAATQLLIEDIPRCIAKIEADKELLKDVFMGLTGSKWICSMECADECLLLTDRIRKSLGL